MDIIGNPVFRYTLETHIQWENPWSFYRIHETPVQDVIL